MEEENIAMPEIIKEEIDAVAGGVVTLLIFPFVLRFMRAILVFIWFFVVVVFLAEVIGYSVQHGNPFHLGLEQLDSFMNYFTFGKMALEGDGDVSPLILRSLLQWVFIVGVIFSLIGGAYDKWKHRVLIVLPFRETVINRMKFHLKILSVFLVGTFLINLITEGGNSASAILFGYGLFLGPCMMGAVFLVTALEKGVVFIGERYFGIRN